MSDLLKSGFDSLKNKTLNRLTDNVVVTNPLSVGASGSIHSLADVDIHSITEEVSQAFDHADIGTWAYNPSINYALYQASMEINRNEKETTLNILGTDAANNGDGTIVMANRNQPSATESIDYITNFQVDAENNEWDGYDTTQREVDLYNGGYYSGLNHGEMDGVRHNDLYTQSYDLYYDDENKLPQDRVTNVIKPRNINSIVAKTKQLFNDNKINTIVSAFHTRPGSPEKMGSAITAKYGMSHGRNLLLKSAERSNNGNYNIHGYDNPYCRVWTHHYQYNRRDRLIRPFVTFDDPERENTTSTDIAEFHNFGKRNAAWKDPDGKYAWKGGDIGWEMSVLHNSSKNGLVNIAPKYSNDPNHKTIRPIDCMFSIENLAWQGYDPYSFEKALSNEQRGPMGGRIMWFPPYGLTFQEGTSADWKSHSFIGRGEPVYTYNNAERTGSISFLLLVDHPSYTDLHLQHNGEITTGKSTKEGTTDTDFLRFFAGCDMGDVPEVPRRIKRDEEDETETDDIPDDLMKFSFYVFYPNNYSGVHDTPGSKVEAIPYLLAGTGAQKANNIVPTAALDANVKKKQDKLNDIKEKLKEMFTNKWIASGVGDISKFKSYIESIPTVDLINHIDNDGFLSGTPNPDRESFALYCGDYDSISDFCVNLLNSTNSDLSDSVKIYMTDFKTNMDKLDDKSSEDEDFNSTIRCLLANLASLQIKDNIDQIFLDNDGDNNLDDWRTIDSPAVTDMKESTNKYIIDIITNYQNHLTEGYIKHKTTNPQKWNDGINNIFNDIVQNISDYYVENAVSQIAESILLDPDFPLGNMFEAIQDKYIIGIDDLEAISYTTATEIKDNNTTFCATKGEFDKTNKLKEHFYFYPSSGTYTDNPDEFDTNNPNILNGYEICYVDENGKENIVTDANGKVWIYNHGRSYNNLVNSIETVAAGLVSNLSEAQLPSLTEFIDLSAIKDKIISQVDDLVAKYSKMGEINDIYRGCFFTTPYAEDETKCALNYYDYDLGEWVNVNTNITLEKGRPTAVMVRQVDDFIKTNIPNAKPNQEKYAEDLILYLNDYFGIMQLLSLDENYTSQVQTLLGSQNPTIENVNSNAKIYDNIIAEKSTTGGYPLAKYVSGDLFHGYYIVYPFNVSGNEIEAERSAINDIINEYVNGETTDLDEFTCVIEEFTPAYIDQVVTYYNEQLGKTKAFHEFSGNELYHEVKPVLSFSELIDQIFKSIYQIEKEINATSQTSGITQYKNNTDVSDDSDIAISMDKLFESNGVGYEMLKDVVNNELHKSYNELRNKNLVVGVSNVKRLSEGIVKNQPVIKNISDKFDSDVSNDTHSGSFPTQSINPNLTWEEISDNHIKGTRPNWQSYKSSTYIPTNQNLNNWDGYDYIPWYYRIDGKYKVPTNETERFENYYDQFLEYYRIDKVQNNAIVFSNYRDSQSYGLNCDIDMVKTAFQIKDSDLASNKETLYSLAEVAYTLCDNQEIKDKLIEQGLILEENNAIERIETLSKILNYSKSPSQDTQKDFEIVKIEALGFSNSHANNASQNVNKNRNEHLATNRAKTVINWFKNLLPNLSDDVYNYGVTEVQTSPSTNVGPEPNNMNDVSTLKAKQYRSAKVTIYVKQNIDKDFKSGNAMSFTTTETIYVDTSKSLEIDGMMFAPTSDSRYFCHLTNKSIWYNDNGTMKQVMAKKTSLESTKEVPLIAESYETNILRYDDESKFFRELQIKDPIVFAKLVDKLEVFDPAFHSMTPEGFNARLTFLNQCMRQGDTHTLSDTNRVHTPKNLQFGKAPICVLRLGDFYHQQIVIKNLSIDYNEASLDLNTEGIGVQPMLAKVTLQFNFIGGSDMAGAVQRLQNAATFNYYANTRLYDNRADRVYYEEGNTGVIDTKRTYSHNVPYAGIDTRNKPIKK